MDPYFDIERRMWMAPKRLEQMEMFPMKSRLPDGSPNPDYRKHYHKVRPKRLAYASRRYVNMRTYADSKKSCPCIDCGVQYPPYVMQFDRGRGEKALQIVKRTATVSMHRLDAEVTEC